MYAVVEIGGFQYKVEQDKFFYVPLLDAESGTTISIDKVLLISKNNEIVIGAPYVPGVCVLAKVLEGKVRSDKIIVFKKIRRKGYRKKQGHRQNFSKIFIEKIG